MGLPAFKNAELNPYNSLLYSSIGSLPSNDVKVLEYKPLRSLRQVKILHIHWPDHQWNQPSLKTSLLRSFVFTVDILLRKALGCKVVWTAHNSSPHQIEHKTLSCAMQYVFEKLIDGKVFLTEVSANQQLNRSCIGVPYAIIPHGHYKPTLTTRCSRENARVELQLPVNAKILLCFGALKKYKGIEALIDAFRATAETDLRLVIAGGASDPNYASSLHDKCRSDPRIMMVLEVLSERKLQRLVESADLVVLPYKKVLNSGSAIYALSNNRPILVTKQESFWELGEKVGVAWVMQCEDLSSEVIRNALRNALALFGEPNLSSLNWEDVATKHVSFYKSLYD